MYYYLSFLRPPPSLSLLNASVIITPQVSNDLRTEPYHSPLDIFYFWTSADALRATILTKPAKLTTWRSINAYKETPVNPPPRLRNGDQCCLILTARPNTALDIDLTSTENLKESGHNPLAIPLTVSSLPITFVNRLSGGKQQKQESILRSFRMFDGSREDESSVKNEGTSWLLVKEQTSYDLDKVRRLP